MAKERIGYRQLYDSIGCSLSEGTEIEFNITLEDIEVVVYIGNLPRRGIIVTTQETSKYVLPDGISPAGEWKFFKNATESNYPRSFFTEIQCIRTIEVPDELSNKFHNEKGSTAHNEIIDRAKKDIKKFKETITLITGVIGLRFHPQFIKEMINENLFVIRNKDDWAYRITGSWMEVLEKLSLNSNGAKALEKTLSDIQKASPKAQEFAKIIFQWMIRAWSERDSVSKFLALFTPLEIALGVVSNGDVIDNQQIENFDKIKDLVSNSNEKDKEKLLIYLEYLGNLQKPSLAIRFEMLAKEINFQSCDKDILAFRKFNKIRNSLLHRGDPNIELIVSVGEDEAQQLEDLVERYISWILFRDNIVYQSRWRGK